jgi:hypothetical protein
MRRSALHQGMGPNYKICKHTFGRGIGALFPTLVGSLSTRVSLGHAISAFAVAAYLVMVFAVLLLPESRGKELRVYE